MRRMIMTSLVLLPVMSHAQAGTIEHTPSTFLAMNEAGATHSAEVVGLARIDGAEKTGATEATRAPAEWSDPKVIQAVEVHLSAQELAEQPAVSNVVVRALVDSNGIPRNVAVTQSGGAVIDRRAIEAVNQYRFKPARLNNKPTWASVSIAIKIQRP